MSVSMSFLGLILMIVQFVLRKKIINPEADRMSETNGKYVAMWGNITLIAISILIYITLDFTNLEMRKLFWLSSLVVLLFFNAFLEWKFIRESKEHIVTVITLILAVVYQVGVFLEWYSLFS